jgi:hypothetical protein
MGLILVLVGLLGASAGIIGYSTATIRNAESILPDHDTFGATAPA